MNIQRLKVLTKKFILEVMCLSAGILLLFAGQARAGFEVMAPEDMNYGNAQNETFKRAIEQDEPLTSSDRAFMASVQDARFANRWYWMGQFSRPTETLKGVTNTTTGLLAGSQPTTKSAKDDVYQIVVGVGYKWTRWAADMEILVGQNINYTSNPILTGQTFQVQTEIKPFALFFDVEYEIPTFFDFVPSRFHPYASLGTGLVVKTVENTSLSTAGQSRQVVTNRTTTLPWQFSLGAKYQVTGSFLVDIAYRWIDYGSVKIGPIEGISLKASDLYSRGFYVGVTYLR